MDRICIMEHVKCTVGYLYVNYSHTNSCYSHVELISGLIVKHCLTC